MNIVKLILRELTNVNTGNIINEVELDYKSRFDVAPRIYKQTIDPVNLENALGDFTLNLRLPKTVNNDKALRYINDFQKEGSFYNIPLLNAELIVNNTLIIRGQFYISKITPENYECYIIGENISWKNLFTTDSIRNLRVFPAEERIFFVGYKNNLSGFFNQQRAWLFETTSVIDIRLPVSNTIVKLYNNQAAFDFSGNTPIQIADLYPIGNDSIFNLWNGNGNTIDELPTWQLGLNSFGVFSGRNSPQLINNPNTGLNYENEPANINGSTIINRSGDNFWRASELHPGVNLLKFINYAFNSVGYSVAGIFDLQNTALQEIYIPSNLQLSEILNSFNWKLFGCFTVVNNYSRLGSNIQDSIYQRCFTNINQILKKNGFSYFWPLITDKPILSGLPGQSMYFYPRDYSGRWQSLDDGGYYINIGSPSIIAGFRSININNTPSTNDSPVYFKGGYIVPVDGEYNISFNINVIYPIFSSPVTANFYIVQYEDNIPELEFNILTPEPNNINSYIKYKKIININNNQNQNISDNNIKILAKKGSKIQIVFELESDIFSLFFYILINYLDIQPLVNELYIEPERFLPDLSFNNFLRDFTTNFNLTVQVDNVNKTITFLPFNDFLLPAASAINWDNKCSLTQATQEPLFKFKEINFQFANAREDNPFIGKEDWNFSRVSQIPWITDKKNITVNWQPTSDRNYTIYQDNQIYGLSINTQTTLDYLNSTSPGDLFFGRAEPKTDWPLYITRLPKVDPGFQTFFIGLFDLTWNGVDYNDIVDYNDTIFQNTVIPVYQSFISVDFNRQYPNQYEFQLFRFENGYQITLPVNLNEIDINELNLRRPVIIQGQIFYITEVSGYDPINNVPTTVKLIKI
jgi:hypothetical protein